MLVLVTASRLSSYVRCVPIDGTLMLSFSCSLSTRTQNFDGLVLEQGYPLSAQIYPFIIGLANELHELNKKIILVIPVPLLLKNHIETATVEKFPYIAGEGLSRWISLELSRICLVG